jgi:hypothetical protein
MPTRTVLAWATPRYTTPPMDTPVTPEEELLDALHGLEVGLLKLVDFLEILLCEAIAAGSSFPAHAEDGGP